MPFRCAMACSASPDMILAPSLVVTTQGQENEVVVCVCPLFGLMVVSWVECSTWHVRVMRPRQGGDLRHCCPHDACLRMRPAILVGTGERTPCTARRRLAVDEGELVERRPRCAVGGAPQRPRGGASNTRRRRRGSGVELRPLGPCLGRANTQRLRQRRPFRLALRATELRPALCRICRRRARVAYHQRRLKENKSCAPSAAQRRIRVACGSACTAHVTCRCFARLL